MENGMLVKIEHPMVQTPALFLNGRYLSLKRGRECPFLGCVVSKMGHVSNLSEEGWKYLSSLIKPTWTEEDYNSVKSLYPTSRNSNSVSNQEVKVRLLKQAAESAGVPIEDFEYLLHHIESVDGIEEIHHCYLYDHIGNLFEQKHLVVKGGVVELDGESIVDGVYHVLDGLESSQDISWSDEQAVKNNIKPKRMVSGMTFKEKAKEWR